MSRFKLNNLELALCIALKFYTSMAKELKLKVRKFSGKIPRFVEVTEKKLVGGDGGGGVLFAPSIQNRVNKLLTECKPKHDAEKVIFNFSNVSFTEAKNHL